MSSPIAPPSFGEIFDTLQNTPHILSSPVQSAFPAFDPSSPFNSIRKTPNDRGLRARMRTTEGFLISPITSSQTSNSIHSLQSSSNHLSNAFPDRTRTPTLGFRPVAVAATPVQIADPDSQPNWDGMDFSGMNGEGIDMSAFDDGVPYGGSPFKAPPSQTNDNVSTPLMIPMPDPTPTQSPTAPRSASKKPRSIAGLGTPSGVHRSAKRIRQATYDANSMPVSPSAQRRRPVMEPSTSLTTSIPLSRAVSSSSIFLGPGAIAQDRNVSSSSAMTVSTSYEVMSPTLQAYNHEMMFPPVPASTSLPELMPSHPQQPSPNLSGGRSPICTPQQPAGVFYTSPETDQGVFGHSTEVQGDMNLMSQVSSMMPQSTSMASVASFPGSQGYRHNTLTTIVETPLLSQEGMSFSAPNSTHLPTQPGLPPQPQFQHMDYPPVPGLSLNYQPGLPITSQGVDIHAWSAQTYSVNNHQQQQRQQMQPQEHMQQQNAMFGFHPQHNQQMPHAPQRHASASFLNYQMRTNEVPVFPNVPRSVSAPYVHTMNNMPPAMSHSLSQGGLFGPAPPQMDGLGDFQQQQQSSQGWSRSTPVSPETPRKRQTFPPVGKRLKPGPKPKPKTPKKAKGEESDNPTSGSGIDPSLLAGPSQPPMPLKQEDHAHLAQPMSSREPSPKPALIFGPDLSSVQVMQRTASNSSQHQPQLVIQPPRSAYGAGPSGPPSAGAVGAGALNADGSNASGLPRAFLEKLYTTFLTLDGSMTGQPVKRFKCLIEGCERHFPRKSAIHSHIQTHLEDKPYVCTAEDCHAAFVRQHDLRRHMRIHSGTKPFPCPCGKGFARGDALMRHRQRGICSGSLVPRRDES
ncbi:hypothetical protein CI109_100786 [Kwoniella shandongensis]|uniref:C2H2-type domain-containing protein n=1 Tax=Kwoniella shandongensis TaxID=1734106 RepID=A0AAJ8MUB2_9TREE